MPYPWLAAHRVTRRGQLACSIYNKTFSPAQAQIRMAEGHCQPARHHDALPAASCRYLAEESVHYCHHPVIR